ncbi:MAG: hypothetical protein DMG37_24240 [Acidobacteria bacterium]|nr:MAG: hypothetical protein DMG37_24240 [Acidobacteriota bacterium]
MRRDAGRNREQRRGLNAKEFQRRRCRTVRKNLFVVGLVAVLFAIPAHADDDQATESHLSAVNIHIGGGIGVPMDPTGNFAGVGGTFQAGAGPNLGNHHSIVGEFM